MKEDAGLPFTVSNSLNDFDGKRPSKLARLIRKLVKLVRSLFTVSN